MGSKRSMLGNGLGLVLENAVKGRMRFVDLFCGSGAVSSHVGSRYTIPVWGTDLQQFAILLTRSQILRTDPFESSNGYQAWTMRASSWLAEERVGHQLDEWWKTLEATQGLLPSNIHEARHACDLLPSRYPLTRAYGGHYFSPSQALALDSLRATVGSHEYTDQFVAALIQAASDCAASPGHTAQPFSPTATAFPHLINAWRKNVTKSTQVALEALSRCCVSIPGTATQQDAISATLDMSEGDVAFVDPPYSEVQYSRFYHVLEAVALGHVMPVSGVGRYPPITERPQSRFSRKSESVSAFDDLMISIAACGAHAIITFPAEKASNGLTGQIVEQLCSQYFRVIRRDVSSRFSTLGGNNSNRGARQTTSELILHLRPR